MIDLTKDVKILFCSIFLLFQWSDEIYYLIGEGKVGSALKKHFNKNQSPFEIFDVNRENDLEGVLFLAVPDDVVCGLYRRISEKFRKMTLIHFSAGSDSEDLNLLHPYYSIAPDTNLNSITFTLWTKTPEKLKKQLKNSGLNFVFAGTTPSPLYHASAVISGNFAQFFILSAIELLQNEGFSKKNAEKLIDQLMMSSIKNASLGIKGVSGPASRGDIKTIQTESEALAGQNIEIAEIFKKINKMIKEAVDNGTIFTK